jgi:hypothetical protein
LSHERTIRQFVQAVKDATGAKISCRWGGMYRGWYLVDLETGDWYPLGQVPRRHVLAPEDQESICRGLHRKEWIVLLGLNPPDDD